MSTVVWVATADRPLPANPVFTHAILLCRDGSEYEAVQLRALIERYHADFRDRRRCAVLMGRISIDTLRHLGTHVQHVVARPATEASQPGGRLWEDWARIRNDTRWQSLDLDMRAVGNDHAWVQFQVTQLQLANVKPKRIQ